MTRIQIFIAGIVVLILGVVLLAVTSGGGANKVVDTKYDGFAQCLNDKGAVFYGAFWCSHCKAQKKLFGSSQRLLNYVECSTADANDTTQVCKEKNITGYPTWEFADGSRPFKGNATLAQLAEKTSCVLPE